MRGTQWDEKVWVSSYSSVPGGCNRALEQAGEKAFPSTADLRLGGSANQAVGLPEVPGMISHVPAKVDSGEELAGPPGCSQKLPPQLKPILPSFVDCVSQPEQTLGPALEF